MPAGEGWGEGGWGTTKRLVRRVDRWFGQGLLTGPSPSTDGLPVPDRWRVTCVSMV
jgi:hypothetical protein